MIHFIRTHGPFGNHAMARTIEARPASRRRRRSSAAKSGSPARVGASDHCRVSGVRSSGERGRELAEIVNAERLLEVADVLQRPLEPATAQQLVLLVLETIPEPVELRRAVELAKNREELRVLPGGVRGIHA